MIIQRYITRFILLKGFSAAALIILISIHARADMPTSQFLLVGQGARAEAMGEAVVADCFDETAAYWNPAAMAFARYPEIGFNSETLADGMFADNAGFIYPRSKYSFGFRLITLNSQIDNYDIYGNKLSQGLGENDLNFNVLTSYRLNQNIALGVGLGNTSMNLSTPGVNYGASTPNLNLGAAYNKDSLSIGASIANIGGTIKFTSDSPGEPQPLDVRIGGAYKLLLDDKPLMIDAAFESNIYDANAGGFRLGSEYTFVKYFALRGGLMIEKYGDVKPTIGFGAYYYGFGLDYAATIAPASMSDMIVSRIGLSYKFGMDASQN